MTDETARKTVNLSHLLMVIAAILAIYLLVGFGRQIDTYRQRKEELATLDRDIDTALQEQAQLDNQIRYAQSDQAAEEWGRLNGMAKPGEVPVVIVAPSAESSAPGARDGRQNADMLSLRETWWDLFFGAH